MPTPLMRNGKIVGKPFGEAGEYDLKRLTRDEADAAHQAVLKSQSGGQLTKQDITAVARARMGSRTKVKKATGLKGLEAGLRDLNRALREASK